MALPRHVAQVAIGNGSHVGGGTELIPGARPGDGRLVVADGEISEPYGERTYEVRPAAVRMYLPRDVDLVDQLD